MTAIVKTQKQIETTFKIGQTFDELAQCPYCGAETRGKYDKRTNFLAPAFGYTCRHFCGFVAGAGGRPTALFQGWSDEEPGEL